MNLPKDDWRELRREVVRLFRKQIRGRVTQRDLADSIGVSLATINFILNHPTYMPRPPIQEKLQEYLERCPEEVTQK